MKYMVFWAITTMVCTQKSGIGYYKYIDEFGLHKDSLSSFTFSDTTYNYINKSKTFSTLDAAKGFYKKAITESKHWELSSFSEDYTLENEVTCQYIKKNVTGLSKIRIDSAFLHHQK